MVSYHSIYLHFHAHLNSNQQVVCLLKFCGKHHIYLSIKHTFCEALTCFTLPINKRKHISTNLCWCSQQNHTSVFPNKIQNKFTSRNSFTILYVIIKLYNILPQTIWVIKFTRPSWINVSQKWKVYVYITIIPWKGISIYP